MAPSPAVWSFPPRGGLKTDKAEATMGDGVLTLTMPKAEEVKPKAIEVKPKEKPKEKK